MAVSIYRALFVLAASLCLLTAGCGSEKTAGGDAPPAPPQVASAPPEAAPAPPTDGMDTESTIWTIMGLAKKPSQLAKGPKLGAQVSPSLWRAAHDALDFVKIDSEDPMSGMVQTAWYSPPDKPNERLRVSVFILSIALRTDSLAVTVDRETRSPAGQWQKTTVDREVVDNLENTILLRARHLHAEEYRSMM
jgi:hypothetical protein